MRLAAELIGIFIIGAIMMAVPILATLSIAYHWDGIVQLSLCLCSFVEYCGLVAMIGDMK